MNDQLELAVNHAVSESVSRARMGLLNPNMGLDHKRGNAWAEYGWKQHLQFADFYNLYRRGGLAFGAVNKLAGRCWKTMPWIIEGEDDSTKETRWEKLAKRTLNPKFWRKVAEADKRRLVGRYSGLVLRVRDSREWRQPVTKSKKELVEVIPAWEGALTVAEYDTVPSSETYGHPKMWNYKETGADGTIIRDVKVHPDRVFIFGDYTSDAVGFLEPVFNNFVSLEKVEGGSGESFLKNASRQLGINFDTELDFNSLAAMYGVSVSELQERFNEVAKEINAGNDALLITQGAQTSPLVSDVPDPTPTYEINLNTVSAGVDMPSRILIGNQSGERSSTEDNKYFSSRCQGRRINELTFELQELVEHLMRIGCIEKADFTVKWDDLTEPTTEDRLNNAKLMSEINNTSLATGEAVFSNDEIRTAADYEVEETEPLPDEDDA